MKILVGYTGFVGSNILRNMEFDAVFNSTNIEEAYGSSPDLLIYSGIRAEKFFADTNPEEDLGNIRKAIEIIKAINPRRLVLISTIDVYGIPNEVDEDSEINESVLTPYGANRRLLEKTVQNMYSDALIVRLPALFGHNLKKNFLYDYIHFIPSLLNTQKYQELSKRDDRIRKYYQFAKDGFYRCCAKTDEDREKLKECLKELEFSALHFTDSRSMFQFYNLAYLVKHIQTAFDYKIKVLNLAVEPILVSEVYFYLKGEVFVNETGKAPFHYNFKTKYADLFGGENGYIFAKDTVLSDIKNFVKEECHV